MKTASNWSTDDEVPFDPQVVVELFAEAAHTLHHPGPIEPKLEWAVRAVRAATDARLAAYVDFADEPCVVASTTSVNEAQQIIDRGLDDHLAELRVSGQPVHAHEPVTDARGSLVLVPVPKEDGEPHGAFLLVLAPGVPGAPAGWITETIALHLGAAISNTTTIRAFAELEAAREEVVQRLQEAVRPPMPEVADADLGVYYRAAEPGAPIGGDLYDWHLLPDGDLHLAVVDVTGRGVKATKDALAVTHALRILVLEDFPPGELVARLDRVLGEATPDLVATLIVGRYRPSTGDIQLAGGGHPPAVVVDTDGRVEYVEVPGIPIGWPGAGSTRVEHLRLRHNQALVLYTDGVIEATRNILYGLQALGDAAREVAQYPAHFMARGIVERALEGAAHRDDSLALVLRHRVLAKPAPAVLGPFHYRFSPSTATVPLARHLFADWLDYQPVDGVHRGDLLFVATELCTNAVRAASGAPGSVELRAAIDEDAVVIEVEDDGGGLVAADSGRLLAPPAEDEAGRGLFLVRALTDELEIFRRDGHTVARCVKRAALVPL